MLPTFKNDLVLGDRWGFKGAIWGASFGLILTTALFFVVGSFYAFLLLPIFIWIGYAGRTVISAKINPMHVFWHRENRAKK